MGGSTGTNFASRRGPSRDAAPADVRILVGHHHLVPAPDYGSDTALPGTREVLEALNDMGVELVFGGHVHRAYVGDSLDVFPGGERGHGIVIVQCGTTTSHRGRTRERGGNSFNVVRITSEHLEVTHYMYFEELSRFAPSAAHALPRGGRRYFLRDPFQGPMPSSTAEDRPVPQEIAR